MITATYKNPLRRFIFRKNFVRKVFHRVRKHLRKATKDEFDDMCRLFEGAHVEHVFDVGANIGFVTNQLTTRFPTANIYSFEPNPHVMRVLQEAHAGNPRVHPVPMGVADQPGTLVFQVRRNSGTSSFLDPVAGHVQAHESGLLETREVLVTTLDEFAEREGISHVSVVKLDVEGYELKALQGAQRLLARQAIDALAIEVSVVPSYEGQPLFHEITQFLAERQYHLFSIGDFVVQESRIRQARLGNAIYISTRFRADIAQRVGTANCGW